MTRRWPIVASAATLAAAVGIGIAVHPQLTGHTANAQVASARQLAAWEDNGVGMGRSASTDALVQRYANAARRSPDDPQAFAQLALAYMQKERETTDVQYYSLTDRAASRALQLDPSNGTAISAEAWVAMGEHDFARAATIATAALQNNASNPEMLGNLGDAEANLGNYPAMTTAYQKMVDAKPGLTSYNRAAYVRWLNGDLRGAVRYMLLAIRVGSTQPENVAWCESELGDYLFADGAVLPAAAEYRAALKAFPHYARALAGLATTQAAIGNTKAAEKLYREAISIVPLPQYLTSLGDLQASLGDRAGAARQYATIHLIEQLFAINHVRYGVEEAQFDAEHNQNLTSALKIAERETQTRHDYLAEDTLAWALYKNGQYSEAWKAESSAMRLGTRLALLDFHAGMIQAKLGHLVEAQSFLHNVLMVNSHFNPLDAPVARAELLHLNQLAAHGSNARP
jgi:tetratricopeptide (TPR) repeat protein